MNDGDARTGAGLNRRPSAQKQAATTAQPGSRKGAPRERDGLYRLLFERNPDAVFELSAAFRFVLANPACEVLSGYRVGELLQKTFMELCAPDRLKETAASLRRALAGHADAQLETALIRKDRRRVEVRIMSEPRVTGGKVQTVCCTVKDLTGMRRAEQQLARDLDAMTRLQKLARLFVQEGNTESVLTEILDAAIAIADADFGNIQLLDPVTGDLRIIAHRGFPNWWLDFWNSVAKGTGVCGTALERGKRIIVENVERSPIFTGSPALAVQLKAGVRAVQSTPLVSRGGKLLGMFSTHWKMAQRPGHQALRLLDLLARQAADLIEHTEASAALRESVARERLRAAELETIFNTAPIGLAIARDTQGHQIRGNLRNEQMFGVPRGAELSKAGPHAACYRVLRDGREVPITQLPMQRAIRGESVNGLEIDIVRQDGRTVAVYANAAPLRDEAGRLRGAVGAFLDMTDRKRAEEALRESESRFRALVQASSDVIYRVSPDWIEMRHLVGRGFISDTTEPNRKWLRKYIPPDERLHVTAAINEAIRTKGVFELEHRVLRVDGSPGWTFSRAVPILDARGEIVEWFGMAGDITQRKEAELVRSRLAAIVECSTDAIFAMDLNGVITDWASGAERLYGYSAAEAIGEPVSLIVPPDRQDEMRRWVDSAKRGETISPFETVGVGKDGQPIAVSVTVSPVRNAAGRIVGASGISRDISERKRLERQLLEVGEREQQRIGHDLHDGLCQELHGLGYLTKILGRELKEELPQRAAEAERVAKVLDHSLRLMRNVARGLQPVNAVPEGLMLSLGELARRTRDLYSVHCRFECREPVLIHQHSTATHLYRIAQEAVNNAIKHARPASIRIRLAATPQRIFLGIRDNGIGIRRRKKPHFPGMGLHIMQYRAEAISGSLAVQRHPAGGTEVVCTVASRALSPR